MNILRRGVQAVKAAGKKNAAQATVSQRIEITVERHSVTRFSRSNGAESAETAEPQLELPAPPDG